MLFGYILLAIALTISSVAAYYSIAGLTAIFAAAFWPIVIMGSVLELGKVATTVWLHKYWLRAPYQFKLYLVPAIAILMLITSMGIFGFLSKAHLDQAVPSGDIASQVQIFDDKISTEKSNIEAARKALKQMDAQVDERLSRSTDDRGAERAVQIRKSQSKERTSLQNEISASQKKITQLQTERAPIASQQRKVEAEVGPIKYIAALIYGDNPDANLLEKAVRWVIILIVFVFDPLALVLILAADQTFEWAREDKKKREGWSQVWQPNTEAWPEWKEEKEDTGVKDFFNRGKELAKKLDAGAKIKDWTEFFKKPPVEEPKYEPDDGPLSQAEIETIRANTDVDLNGIPAEDFLEFINANIAEPTAQEPVKTIPVADIPHADPPPLRPKEAPATDESPINPPPRAIVIHESPNQIAIPDFSIGAEQSNPVNAGFGTQFPVNPVKGDMFLRVDYLPSKLYKWNDKKWIEVDKERTDSFAYNEQYIKHLIDKIDSGEYDVDMLSAAEQEQISRYLNNGHST